MVILHHVSHVMCHVSYVMSYVSRVTCHMSGLMSRFFLQIIGASRLRVCYQLGLPYLVFNRPGVGEAVLQTTWSLICWSFASQSSEHCLSQAVRARELKFFVPPHRVSHVMCQMSHVTCHVSDFFLFLFIQNVEASWWRVCYQ